MLGWKKSLGNLHCRRVDGRRGQQLWQCAWPRVAGLQPSDSDLPGQREGCTPNTWGCLGAPRTGVMRQERSPWAAWLDSLP